MSKTPSTIASIITVVIFLALIALSTILYSGSPEHRVKMEQNFFGRNAKLAMDYVFLGIQGVTDISLGKKYENDIASSTIDRGEAGEEGFFKRIWTSLKEEWNNNGGQKLKY